MLSIIGNLLQTRSEPPALPRMNPSGDAGSPKTLSSLKIRGLEGGLELIHSHGTSHSANDPAATTSSETFESLLGPAVELVRGA